LESAIYVILKKYFREKPYYVDIMELFHEVICFSRYNSLNLFSILTDYPANSHWSEFRSRHCPNRSCGFQSIHDGQIQSYCKVEDSILFFLPSSSLCHVYGMCGC
jgi:hypothetical protein